jgi:sulfatase maturation enzyme AslB (radical SAM superfamily)
MRINNQGHYEPCRWAHVTTSQNIAEVSPITFFQNGMSDIREKLLNGETLDMCSECHVVEKNGKVSGRQKQLLKIGVRLEEFEKTMLSSPWLDEFKNTRDNNGNIKLLPQDWQIDLGNFCNSSCVFCVPKFSSKIATEYLKLGLIDSLPKNSWCNDPVLLQKLVDTLNASPEIKYIHFIGGETLITPEFKTILEILIKSGLNKTVTLGFTTNLTVWKQDIVDLLTQFNGVNLGVSVEGFHPVNDYVRYGSNIQEVKSILQKWQDIAKTHQWYMQLRITPTALSATVLDTVYYYAYENNIPVESCNFITNPDFMRLSVLPESFRQVTIDKLTKWLEDKEHTGSQVVNTRNPTFVKQQLVEDAKSYIQYLKMQPYETELLPKLVNHIKLLESSRKNSILDYLPEYEELLRSAGY